MLREEIEAPEGWAWNQFADNYLSINVQINGETLSPEFDPVKATTDSFHAWLEEHNLMALPYDIGVYRFHVVGYPNLRLEMYVYHSFQIFRPEDWQWEEEAAYQAEKRNCGFCGEEANKRDIFCHNCNTLFYCNGCGRQRDAAHWDSTQQFTSCESCGTACECGRYHSGYLRACEVCEPVYQCGNCRAYTNSEGTEVAGRNCCDWCVQTFCPGCETFTGDELPGDVCSRCEMLGVDGDNEIFDESSNMAATKLALPTIPGREMIRRSGIEIEGGLGKTRSPAGMTGPDTLAKALYDAGLSQTYRQEGYHHGRGFARIETDASCDWECVIGPVDMANIESVRNLNNTVKIVKDHIKTGLLKLDLRCGTHIHVSAEKVSLGQAYNLHLLYTFMEDPLYRLGAAHWPIHRTLINDESHSAKRSPKEMTKTKFARRFNERESRYYGLSFSNYFEKMLNDCCCGAAQYGAFEECECDLHKCTFEFRLFNATANTIKLHAYLALSQALVAKAISMPDVKDPNSFEAFPFVPKRYRDMPAGEQKSMIDHWDSRLQFIATELPLTDDEKKSIYYCVKNSELAKVDSAKELFIPKKEVTN